jgi:hypothetical protein
MFRAGVCTSLQRSVRNVVALGLAALFSSVAAHADALRTNGVCELNDCNNVPLTPANSSSSTNFNFTYQFANSDSYRVQGTIYQGQTSSGSGFYDEIGPSNFIVTYLGNSTNTDSGSDTLSTEFLGSYPSESGGAGYFNSELYGIFGSGYR